MTDFSKDREVAAEITEKIKADLGSAMDGAASISEFTVGTPLEARKPLTKEQWAVGGNLGDRSGCCESFDDPGEWVEGAIACQDAGIRRSRSFAS